MEKLTSYLCICAESGLRELELTKAITIGGRGCRIGSRIVVIELLCDRDSICPARYTALGHGEQRKCACPSVCVCVCVWTVIFDDKVY